MLYACARGVGAEVEKRYSDIVAEVEQQEESQHTTTLEEAEAFWAQALEDSRRAAEEDGGDEV